MTDDELRLLGLRTLIQQAITLLDLATEGSVINRPRIDQARETLRDAISG